MHPNQRHIQSECAHRPRVVQLVQGHMLSVLNTVKSTLEYKAMRKERASRGNQDRSFKQQATPRVCFRSVHKEKHSISVAHACECCRLCGRSAKLSLPVQLQDNVWRPACVPRKKFKQALRRGHTPSLSATPTHRLKAWSCTTCKVSGNSLLGRDCHNSQDHQAQQSAKRSFIAAFGNM